MADMDKKNAPGIGAKAENAVIDPEVMDEKDIIQLSRPMGGRTQLIFDFGKITGAALLKCEKKAKEIDSAMVVPQLSMVFQAHVAAAAAGARYDDIIALAGPDFMAATLRVSRFLSGTE